MKVKHNMKNTKAVKTTKTPRTRKTKPTIVPAQEKLITIPAPVTQTVRGKWNVSKFPTHRYKPAVRVIDEIKTLTHGEFKQQVLNIPGTRYEFKGIKAFIFTGSSTRPRIITWSQIIPTLSAVPV
jgi:hypothetical protein